MIRNRAKFTPKFKELGSALGRVHPLRTHLKAIQAHCEAAGEEALATRAYQLWHEYVAGMEAMLKDAQDREKERHEHES